jgi:hypothetical protein
MPFGFWADADHIAAIGNDENSRTDAAAKTYLMVALRNMH